MRKNRLGLHLLPCKIKQLICGESPYTWLMGDPVIQPWILTHKIPRKKFGVADTFIWTTNRRFMKQGYLKTFSRYFRVAISRDYRQSDNSKYMEVTF